MSFTDTLNFKKSANFSKILFNFCGLLAFFAGSILAPYQAVAYTNHLPDEHQIISPKINTSKILAYQPLEKSAIIIPQPQIIFSGKTTTTAYSSTTWQTDNDPWTTASGSQVFDGALATNFLPFGTQVTFPEIFGDKIFTVVDRMNARHSDKMDIWFAEYQSAKNFGVKYLAYNIVSQ